MSNFNRIEQPFAAMMVGVPGSGKSTVARRFAEALELTYICPDDIREELSGDASDQTVTPQAWQLTHERAEQALKENESVIIDATYAREGDRKRDAELFRSFGAKAVIGIFVNTPLEVALKRNHNPERGRVVPDLVIKRMAANLAQYPPTEADGFDQLIVINTAADK